MKVDFDDDGTARPAGIRAGALSRLLATYPEDTIVLIESGRVVGIDEWENSSEGTRRIELVRE